MGDWLLVIGYQGRGRDARSTSRRVGVSPTSIHPKSGRDKRALKTSPGDFQHFSFSVFKFLFPPRGGEWQFEMKPLISQRALMKR